MSQPSHDMLEAAANWYMLLQSGQATPAQRQQWQTWLAESDQHRTAWQYAERVSQRFAALQGAPARPATETLSRKRSNRRQVLSLAALAGSGTFGWAVWRHTGLQASLLALGADHRSSTGEIRKITLADGSQLWLNSASAVNQDFDASQRQLTLLRGELLVQTAADATRPFIVATPQGSLQALGTRFTVRLQDDQNSLLAVYEGAVRITTSGNASTGIIQAGEQSQFSPSHISPAQYANPANESWRNHVLIAQNMPLHEVVAELRRHYSGHIGLDPAIAKLPVLGSYPITDPMRALKMLEGVLPIQVRQTLPWWISITPA